MELQKKKKKKKDATIVGPSFQKTSLLEVKNYCVWIVKAPFLMFVIIVTGLSSLCMLLKKKKCGTLNGSEINKSTKNN